MISPLVVDLEQPYYLAENLLTPIPRFSRLPLNSFTQRFSVLQESLPDPDE